MTLRIAILAACAGTLILTSAGAALAINDPIPGIDIIIKSNAGNSIKVGDCQSGGGKVVKQGSAWVCTGMPTTGVGKANNPSSKAGTPQRAPARLDNTNSRTKGSRSSTGFAPLRPAEF